MLGKGIHSVLHIAEKPTMPFRNMICRCQWSGRSSHKYLCKSCAIVRSIATQYLLCCLGYSSQTPWYVWMQVRYRLLAKTSILLCASLPSMCQHANILWCVLTAVVCFKVSLQAPAQQTYSSEGQYWKESPNTAEKAGYIKYEIYCCAGLALHGVAQATGLSLKLNCLR